MKDKKNERLLAALKKIKDASDKEGIDFWLLGGLANAFHLGRIYREFGDLDLIIKNSEDYERFCHLLENNDFIKIRDKKLNENLVNSIYINSEGVEVDVGPNIGEFGLIEEDFEEEEKILGNVRCKILSKRFLKSFKEYLLIKRSYEKDKLDLYALDGKF